MSLHGLLNGVSEKSGKKKLTILQVEERLEELERTTRERAVKLSQAEAKLARGEDPKLRRLFTRLTRKQELEEIRLTKLRRLVQTHESRKGASEEKEAPPAPQPSEEGLQARLEGELELQRRRQAELVALLEAEAQRWTSLEARLKEEASRRAALEARLEHEAGLRSALERRLETEQHERKTLAERLEAEAAERTALETRLDAKLSQREQPAPERFRDREEAIFVYDQEDRLEALFE